MMPKSLIPSVQNHGRGWLHASLGCDRFLQRVRSGMEQEFVKWLAVAKYQRREFSRNGEDSLKVGHLWMQQLGRSFDPIGATSSHALRTMPIGARVVKVDLRITLSALVHSTAHRRRTTEADPHQRVFNMHRKLAFVPSHEMLGMLLQYSSDSDYWSRFGLS